MATAGFNARAQASLSETTGYEQIGGANSFSLNLQRAMLDVTEFGDSAVDRIAGLLDTPISISGHYAPANAGQAILEAAVLSGALVYIQITRNGTNGYRVPTRVESFSLSGEVAGLQEFTASLQSAGAAVVIPT